MRTRRRKRTDTLKAIMACRLMAPSVRPESVCQPAHTSSAGVRLLVALDEIELMLKAPGDPEGRSQCLSPALGCRDMPASRRADVKKKRASTRASKADMSGFVRVAGGTAKRVVKSSVMTYV